MKRLSGFSHADDYESEREKSCENSLSRAEYCDQAISDFDLEFSLMVFTGCDTNCSNL